MGFSINHSENEIIPVGEYETRIQSAHESATRSGTPFIQVNHIIRDDVQQPEQGKSVIQQLWMRKEPDAKDKTVGGYSYKQICSLSAAAQMTDGKHYTTIEDWCNDLAGRVVRATVEHDTFQGNTKARVQWANPPQCPAERFIPADEETDEELPF